jgi:hypothetical protein
MKILILLFSHSSCFFLSLKLKCSPQHPFLKHTQSVLLSQCDKPSFTSTVTVIHLHLLSSFPSLLPVFRHEYLAEKWTTCWVSDPAKL